MKHTTSIIKLFSLALFVLVGTACIDNFDKINQKDYQVDKEELGREGYNVGASLKGLQGLVIPTEEHLYQFVEALAAGAFSGYIGCTVEWTAKFETYNPPTDWQEAPFSSNISILYVFSMPLSIFLMISTSPIAIFPSLMESDRRSQRISLTSLYSLMFFSFHAMRSTIKLLLATRIGCVLVFFAATVTQQPRGTSTTAAT